MSREGKVYDGRGDISLDFDRDYKALKKLKIRKKVVDKGRGVW